MADMEGAVMIDYAVQTNELTRDFGSVRAVDHLTLKIPRGMVFGFLGPNGSGKTTTIRMLLGLLEPTSGSAKVLGYDVVEEAAEVRARAGALMEYDGLYQRLTAEDNLEFYGRIYNMPRERRKARVRELLQHLGLWERRREMVRDWSRGMRQKLAVARALLHRPPLVLLDEPTSGLDPVAAAALREDLKSLAASEGMTIFLNTHNLVEAEKLCQQVGVIHEGTLLQSGSVESLRNGSKSKLEILGRNFTKGIRAALRAFPDVERVEQEDQNGLEHLLIEFARPVDSAPLIQTIVSAGGEIEEVQRSQSSLEDVFLALVSDTKGGTHA